MPILQISGTWFATFEAGFDSSGSVLVQAGRLELAGGGIADGAFWSNLGAGVAFTQGT
jgi:hypothetical protein